MGLFKRFTEKTKQQLGFTYGDKDFKPTSNVRNVAMIDEARKFSKQLKALHKDLNDLSKRFDGSMSAMKSVLSSPLPRIFEVSDKGAVPVEREAVIVGVGVNFDAMTGASSELRSKLQSEVLRPLEQWLGAYREIKKKNKQCETIRLELDAQRRQAGALAVNLERAKTKAAGSADKAAADAVKNGGTGKLEQVEYKLQTEEDKVTRLTQRFVEKEDEVFNALLSLIRDTAVLKQYAGAALSVYEAAFAQAHAGFAGLAPMPTSSQGGAPGGAVKMSSGGTPDTPQPSAGHPPAPSWYTEARQNVNGNGSLRYESDDDEDHGAKR